MAPSPTKPVEEVEVEIVGSALGAHPGAEAAGIVRDVSEATYHLLDKPVAIPRLLPCGECDLCRRGRVANCPTLVTRPKRPQKLETLPARFLIPLEEPALKEPPPLEKLYGFAALSDALLSPYAGMARAGLSPGSLCVVLGGGFRAALSVVAARIIGAKVAVLCAEKDERAALLLAPYEAVAALDANALDSEAAKAELRQLAKASGVPAHGFCIVETSGSDAGRARALGLLEAGGTAILLDRAQPLDAQEEPGLFSDVNAGPGVRGLGLLFRVAEEGCQIIGAGSPHPDLLLELVTLCERMKLDWEALTTTVEENAIDAVMEARRKNAGDANWRLRLPIVRYEAAR